MSEKATLLHEMANDTNNNENHSFNLKVLLFDCEADSGFSNFLKGLIIKPELDSNFRAITTYDDAKKYINSCDYSLYDVIIMDINLNSESDDTPIENKSGYQLLKDLRQKDLMIPVIIITNSSYELNKPKLDKFGIIELIIKSNPGQEFSAYQIGKLIVALTKCTRNKWHHYVRRILQETYSKTNTEIKSKFRAIMYKQYSAAYLATDYSNQYLEDNHFLHNNETILYLHSIMTDVLRKKQQSGSGLKKQLNGTLVGLNNVGLSNIQFGKEYINNANFQSDFRIRLMDYLNYLRNNAKPIHGNKKISFSELLICLIAVTYEVNEAFILKQNKFGVIAEHDNILKTAIQNINKRQSENTEAVKLEKERMLDICSILDCNYNKISNQV